MTKERLRHYRDIKKESEQLRQSLEEIETVLFYPKTQRLTGMPSNPSEENYMEDLAIRHIGLQALYKDKLAELEAEQIAIEKAIDALDPMARMLLRYRYISGLSWEEVCVKMNYSWRQTHRLHGEALNKLRELEENEP